MRGLNDWILRSRLKCEWINEAAGFCWRQSYCGSLFRHPFPKQCDARQRWGMLVPFTCCQHPGLCPQWAVPGRPQAWSPKTSPLMYPVSAFIPAAFGTSLWALFVLFWHAWNQLHCVSTLHPQRLQPSPPGILPSPFQSMQDCSLKLLDGSKLLLLPFVSRPRTW